MSRFLPKILPVFFLFFLFTSASAKSFSYRIPSDGILKDTTSEEQEIKSLVVQILELVGSYQLDELEKHMAPNANIGISRYSNGAWKNSVFTMKDAIADLRAQKNPTHVKEPVSKFTIHIDSGQIAFVKADAKVYVNGKETSNDINFFTLIKIQGQWKLLNVTYTVKPVE